MKKSKYHSKKIVYNGITFDSKREYLRYRELLLLERAGAITNLERQVKYVLIPAQYEVIGYTKTGKEKKKCIERECSYMADFQYIENGKTVVEDTKGFRTKDYILKRKMLLYFHGIKIREV